MTIKSKRYHGFNETYWFSFEDNIVSGIKNNSYEREVLGKERTKGGLGNTIRATRKRPVDIMSKKSTYSSFVRDHRKTSLLILSEFERIN